MMPTWTNTRNSKWRLTLGRGVVVPPPGFNKFYSNWYSNLYGIRKFYGYKAHFNYLDYFVKTDVAMREGQMHPSSGGMQKQQ